MPIETERNGTSVLIRARGWLDHRTSPTLRVALMEAAARRAREVVVDMSAVGHVDSSVVATLAEARRILTTRGGRMTIRNLPGILKEVFFLTTEGRRLHYAASEALREGA